MDFAPQRVVVPGPGGFPPAVAEPGAIGEAGYSPLVELPDGTILNAPQIANASGQADKITELDVAGGSVTYPLTDGFARRDPVRYIVHRRLRSGRRDARELDLRARAQRRAVRRR